MNLHVPFAIALLFATAISGRSAITIANLADKMKYAAPRSFTVTADPNAATTIATLDGLPVAVGTATTVTAFGYHELRAESRDASGTLVDSRFVRFITRDSRRGDSEDGIPPHTPFRVVNDAPSAFTGFSLKVIAPAAWPVGLPVPISTVLRDSANETVRLNGLVKFGGFPQTMLQMRRGWGSVVAPAAMTAGLLDAAASVNDLTAARTINLEAAPTFTDVSGTLSANTTWPANSRIHVTGTLIVEAGVALTIGAGTIVAVHTGTGVVGSAAEIVVNGTLQVNGTEAAPVVFTPDIGGQFWGGIELPTATSQVHASYTIFTGSGEDETWFSTRSGYATHQPHQALFLVSGSGAGTEIGAQLHLENCFCFDLAGQEMNSRTNTWIDLQRTLMQRAITCGELNGSKVTIDRCALIEFPSEDPVFADADNDAIYLTNGDFTLTNNVIGFCKDDGVDSGGNGGDNPYTAAPDVTPFVLQNNWFEGTYHEGNSLSGTRNVSYTGCVFFNCGQGVEAGYSTGTTGDGPNAMVDSCLFVSNMVGVRWGDNYGPGYSYNPTMEVQNSLVLNSLFHDAWSYNWHPTAANAWIYQTTATNSFGRPYFNVHDNLLSQPDPVHHPANTTWDPANPAHTAALQPFMPVPGSKVGVAISSYDPEQVPVTDYPGIFTARLSTFSSRPVAVNWSVIGKTDAASPDVTLLSGTLAFAPGETLKTIHAPLSTPDSYSILHVQLSNPVNAEVTGDAWYFDLPSPVLINFASTWKYRDNGSDQGTAWRQPGFNDSSWAQGPAQLGYGDNDEATRVEDNPTPGYTAADANRYATTYFRKTFIVEDISQVASLSVTLLYDDGGVVYLNGERVAATAGMPIDPAFNYFIGENNPSENATITAEVPVSLLVNGLNTIAVEIHQQNASSSDMSFDLQLTATYEFPFELQITRTAQQLLLYWFNPGAILETSTDLSAWTSLPTESSPATFTPAEPRRFFRLRR